ncbi:MAG: phosphoribosylamine--glycine ligase [bacterium]
MKTIVVGSGGREHALGYKLARAAGDLELVFLPGNGGTASLGRNVDVDAEDVEALVAFSRDDPPDLVVVGPENPLASGLADRLAGEGMTVFGPTADCARLESSKAYAKEFMARHSVPTARFEVFRDPARAHAYIESSGTQVVVKADGLARGKGVIVTGTREGAHRAVERIMEERIFGDAGETVVIEERLRGEEASVLAITDGENYLILPPSQDHKPIYDGDEGPNTGGMGAYCPAPLVDAGTLADIERNVFKRTLKGLRAEGMSYRGVIYAGLMLNRDGISVIEYNVRFGDPEAQAIFPAVDIDLGDVLARAAEGRLWESSVVEPSKWAVCVVLASAGYPGPYEKGKPISGLDRASAAEGVEMFHAGTRLDDSGALLTSGGRVMGVTGCGRSLREAQRRAYDGSRLVEFEGKYMRSDIGDKGIALLAKTEVR